MNGLGRTLVAIAVALSSLGAISQRAHEQGVTDTDKDKDDSIALYGYAATDTLAQVLKQCGDDLSQENVMRQAATLADYQEPVLLPGITISTGPLDFRPIKQMRLVQCDVVETAGSTAGRK